MRALWDGSVMTGPNTVLRTTTDALGAPCGCRIATVTQHPRSHGRAPHANDCTYADRNALGADVKHKHVITNAVMRGVDGIDDEHVLEVCADGCLTPRDVIVTTDRNLHHGFTVTHQPRSEQISTLGGMGDGVSKHDIQRVVQGSCSQYSC